MTPNFKEVRKMKIQTKTLERGSVTVYTLPNGAELHALAMGDALGDQAILVYDEGELLSIEGPLFDEDARFYEQYCRSFNAKKAQILLVDHLVGKSCYPEAELIAPENAVDALLGGAPKGLYDNFASAFGGIEKEIRQDIKPVKGTVKVGRVEIEIEPLGEEANVYIPAFEAVYTHMLGHDVHSIVMGSAHAGAIVANLSSFLARNVKLVLTSHYVPEGEDDIRTKIAYVKDLVAIAGRCKSANEFIEKVRAAYPDYGGLNYLEMSAGGFFPAK